MWEESTDQIEYALELNGIYCKTSPVFVSDELVICEVDSTKTELSDFYKWEEIRITDKDTYCWRNFYHTENDDWLSIPFNETLGPYTCKEVCDLLLFHGTQSTI